MNVIEQINNQSNNMQNSMEINYKQQYGIYYTSFKLAFNIVEQLLNKSEILQRKNIWEITFLEPCGGMGNFVFAYLTYIHKNYYLTSDKYLSIIRNIYLCEPDNLAKEKYIIMLKKICQEYFNLSISNDDINVGGSLIYDLSDINPSYISINNYFNKNKFDIIITNPPYKNLRAEKVKNISKENFEFFKQQYSNIKNNAYKDFNYVSKRGANLFKYFIENMLKKFSKRRSLISFLVPLSILTDKSSKMLRKLILKRRITTIGKIPESSNYVNSKQSMVYFNIENIEASEKDRIKIADYLKNDLSIFSIQKDKLVSKENDYSIILVNKNDYVVLDKLNKIPKIKDYSAILNRRGEFDISMDKKFLNMNNINGYPLVKGRNIHRYKLFSPHNGNVYPDFIKKKKKINYIFNERLACQQIVNLNKNNRLIFTLVPRNYILGNSCNFLSIHSNNSLNMYYILGILNSKIVNWYFNLFSSNNHINNYQIDNIPIPIIFDKRATLLIKLVKQMLNNPEQSIDNKINDLVFDIFMNKYNKNKGKINLGQLSLFRDDISEISSKKLKDINKLKNKNILLNNSTYKLSELDKEMIHSIPEGGNWKNIPQKTVNKSKRLQGIQKSGGRTTLYGRLKYDRPSYTITTYFNRPGNGCYIHPKLNRVLTTREGARLQSFPDNYFFYGNQKDKLNQIGNAVPPLIGYQIGYNIIHKLHCKMSTELFAGGGGLLYGMKLAGVKHIIANDFDKSACVTLKINNPEINIINGDITNSFIKEKIISTSIKNKVDIICGGPPCQGFSLAGFRKSDDPRNELVQYYYDVLYKVNPKAFVFENVTGLLSHNKGKTFKDINSLFKHAGYKVVAHKLDFSEYGIPQKRKRVIVIGIRNDIKVSPEELFPTKITANEHRKITVSDAIKSISNVKHNGNFIAPKPVSLYERYLSGGTKAYEFLKELGL